MQTNFFQTLSSLDVQGDWKITIRQNSDNLIVSVLLVDDKCGDDARKVIPPLILKGTPQEIDEGFFNTIEAPVKVTAQLFSNMEAYLKQQEEANRLSKMAKDKESKAVADKSEKDKKYDAAMKKADELEAEGKPREAWLKVPEPSAYPEHADAIRKRRSELSAKFEQTSLF